jgi:hypothetical protein
MGNYKERVPIADKVVIEHYNGKTGKLLQALLKRVSDQAKELAELKKGVKA